MSHPTPRKEVADLVDHFRLETQRDEDITCIRVLYPDRRRRNAKVQEEWRRKDPLGQGSFGLVWLYQKLGPNKDVRAVKEIRKGLNYQRAFNIEYARELYAMAKLTRASLLELLGVVKRG
jgi:hypothetical protein